VSVEAQRDSPTNSLPKKFGDSELYLNTYLPSTKSRSKGVDPGIMRPVKL